MIPFWKIHGLGNDFIVMDATQGGLLVEAGHAKQMCDRYMGIGADGVLTVLPSESGDYRMHIYNADGSQPEMCGNGIRCFVKYLVDHGMVQGSEVRVETGRGVLTCKLQLGADGKVEMVTVNMSPALFDCEEVPMEGRSGTCIEEDLEVDGLHFCLTAVSMGNPHAVLFEKADLAMARKRGPMLANHSLFPNKTNVEFTEVKSRGEIDLVVYERGCGITKACGTGACAATAAAARIGKVDFDREIRVNLPGGSLFVQVESDFSAVWMRGPALEVFRGEFADLAAWES
ncbi:MAG: diaminopimelate epimerase [Deltaproteobacteria bacterium]|nr:diaminopimelate epimerase [Deltaproteobacteria bacterium]